MLRRLVGPRPTRDALDLYFKRHDGQACTIERLAAGLRGRLRPDLGRSAAGMPRPAPPASAQGRWDGARYRSSSRRRPHRPPASPRSCPSSSRSPTGCSTRTASPSPRACSSSRAGEDLEWELLRARSLAAARLLRPGDPRARDLARRARVPLRPRRRPLQPWEAGRSFALALLARLAADPEAEADPAWPAPSPRSPTTPASTPPSRPRPRPPLRGRGPRPHRRRRHAADPLAVWTARRRLEAEAARALGDRPERLYSDNAVPGRYSPDAAAAGRRALRGRALALPDRARPGRTRGRRAVRRAPTT